MSDSVIARELGHAASRHWGEYLVFWDSVIAHMLECVHSVRLDVWGEYLLLRMSVILHSC